MIDRILNWAVPLVFGFVVTYCVTWWRMAQMLIFPGFYFELHGARIRTKTI